MFQIFKKIIAKDPELQRIQDSVSLSLDSVGTSLLINANLVQDVVFVSGVDTYVNHTLPQAPRGFFVVMKTFPLDIYLSSTPSPNPNIIVLKSNASATVSLVFF